ncbi:hypothetical protein, partial [Proteus mirabilis]|uniref:hypothetical protein n=1 Tax=Proteus mirabilis TaxID=584 RepID=UPI002575D8CB
GVTNSPINTTSYTTKFPTSHIHRSTKTQSPNKNLTTSPKTNSTKKTLTSLPLHTTITSNKNIFLKTSTTTSTKPS